MDEREKRFSPGGYRELLTVAYPLVVTSASMTLMHFVDRMFLAWYSQSAIAAVLPAGLTSFTLVSFFMGTSGYTTAIVAQHYGAKEHEKCALATWQGIFFSLFAEIILLFFIPLGSPIFTWGGHSPELISLETTYYTILLLGGGVVPLNNAIASFFVGRGETKVTMVANIMGHATNVLLNYVLIFGKWGFPEMGIKGAAIATVISSTIPPAIMIALFLNSRNHEVCRTRSQCRFDAALFRKLIKFGAPAGIHFALEMSAFTLFLLLVGRIGTLELAVTNISFSINTLAFMPMIGVSLATTTLVGQYIGKNDIPTAEKSTYTALKLALVYMVLVGLIFVLFPETLLSVFKGRGKGAEGFDQVLRLGRWILIMVALYGIFDAMNLVFAGALKGAGDTRFIMWAAIALAWIFFVPPVYFIIEVFELGLLPAWGSATAYICLLGLIFLARFRRGKWKAIDLLGKGEALGSAPGESSETTH